MRPRVAYRMACLAFALCACEKNEPPSEPPEPPRPRQVGSADVRRALADAAARIPLDAPSEAAASAVLSVRDRLPISPRSFPSQVIAFGAGRLGVLAQNQLDVRSATTLAVVVSVPISEPRRLVALLDGALLVAAREATYLVLPQHKSAQTLPKLTLFPDSVLFADRRDARKLWVLHPTARSLYEYAVETGDAGLLSFTRFVTLEDFSGRGFGLLADGSFAYLTGSELRRFFPEGKSWRLALPDSAQARLARGRRIDELWWTPSATAVERLSPVGKLRPLQRVEIGSPIFDLAVEGDIVAVVTSDIAREGRRFRLAVHGADGKRRFEHALEADVVTADEGWAELVTRNLHLAVSPDARLVAVGGADRIGVWETASGRRLGP